MQKSRLFRITLTATLSLIFSDWASPAAAIDSHSSPLVQSALRSEVELNNNARDQFIEESLRRDPNSADAHWASGQVRIRGQWMSLSQAAEESRNRSNLEKYRELREQTDSGVEAHARLAEFCRKHALTAQERAHWTAILILDPNHAAARKRLDHVNVQGTWLDKQQIEQQKLEDRAFADYMRKHGKTIRKIASSLFEKEQSRDDVVRKLRQHRNPAAIPGFEEVFSNQGELGGLCTVDTVSSFAFPEASLSLSRHALNHPSTAVREAATTSLKRRDEFTFVPGLLAALQNPVEKSDRFTITKENQLLWSRSLTTESQAAKNVATLDRVIPLQGLSPEAMNITNNWTQQTVRAADMELSQLNRQIEINNERIAALLTKTTQDPPVATPASDDAAPLKVSPEAWWNWWNAKVESFPAEAKVVLTRYDTMLVQPSVPEFTARRECLAPGTPIWSETGPMAIERVKVGDMVLTQNPRSGELKFAPVLMTTTRDPEVLFSMKLKGESIRATGGHPFWVSGKGWIKTRSLTPGMGLHTPRGVAILESIEEESQPTATHNLIVHECHSYFVGKNLILSHDNTSRQPVANRVPGLIETIARREAP